MASTGSFCRLPRVYSSLHGRMRLVSAFFAQPVNKSESRLLRFLFPNVTSKSKFDINKLLGIIPDAIWVVLKLIQPALGFPPPPPKQVKNRQTNGQKSPKKWLFWFSRPKYDPKPPDRNFPLSIGPRRSIWGIPQVSSLWHCRMKASPPFFSYRPTSLDRDCRDLYLFCFQMWLHNKSLM